MTPTDEQDHICEKYQQGGNILIEALAGTGKSTTLELIGNLTEGSTLALAFNKRNVKDLIPKLPDATVKTINSLGYQVCQNSIAHNITVAGDKMKEILRDQIKALHEADSREEAFDSWSEILAAIGLAKANGYVPDGHFLDAKRLSAWDDFASELDETPTVLVKDLVDICLVQSIKQSWKGLIDFDDQVYMPAIYFRAYPRYDVVLVDEAQDLNRCNHEMLWHMRKSRIVAVGDPHQSIYGFRGAVPDSMDQLRSKFDMVKCNLSVSFRCPETIVRNVHWRTPSMRWFKTGGYVGKLRTPKPSEFVDDSAIVCRNNAPLFSLAFKLLVSGRNVTVAGSDIGPRVLNLLRKLGPLTMTKPQALLAIESWRAEKIAKGSKTCDDMADCMRVFVDRANDLDHAILFAKHLFEQSGSITLTTGHKAKGLEWPSVYHLDPWLIKDFKGDQEKNLRYVIQTRALDSYFEVESKEVRNGDV